MDTANPRSIYDGMSSLKNKSTLACSSWKVLRKLLSHASCLRIEVRWIILGGLEQINVDGYRVDVCRHLDQTLSDLRERSLGKIRTLPAQE